MDEQTGNTYDALPYESLKGKIPLAYSVTLNFFLQSSKRGVSLVWIPFNVERHLRLGMVFDKFLSKHSL